MSVFGYADGIWPSKTRDGESIQGISLFSSYPVKRTKPELVLLPAVELETPSSEIVGNEWFENHFDSLNMKSIDHSIWSSSCGEESIFRAWGRSIRKYAMQFTLGLPRRVNFRQIIRLPALLCIGLIRLYQRFLSPILPRSCRFVPTCSEYTAESLHRFGLLRGMWRGLWRICRCHPFHPGGNDPVD